MTLKERNAKDYRAVKNVLLEMGIKFFAIQGTALGAFREGDFIEWDDDVDLACFMDENQEKVLKEILSAKGFKIDDNHCLEMPDRGCVKIAGYIRAIRYTLVDIYRLLKDEKGYFFNDLYPFYFDEGTLDKLTTVRLGDQVCFAPTPPEAQLVKLFGEDWKTPKITNNRYLPIK